MRKGQKEEKTKGQRKEETKRRWNKGQEMKEGRNEVRMERSKGRTKKDKTREITRVMLNIEQ
jgi:hypothetical protein